MCSRPVGRIPLSTLLFFPLTPVSTSTLLVLVAFVSVLHLGIKSFFEAFYEFEPFHCFFARELNRSSVQHCRHSFTPVCTGVIESRVDCAGVRVRIDDWLNHCLHGHFGGFQQS